MQAADIYRKLFTMETPYTGRATVTDNFDHLEIAIPAKKNGFIVLFLGFWLCGWVFGEVTAITSLLPGSNGAPHLFMIVWLGGWTVGGIFALRIFLWLLFGKEMITAGQGTITVSRKYALFNKPKTYDLKECKNFRTEDEGDMFAWNGFGQRRRSNINNFSDQGTIRFDYGMKTVKFGAGLDVVEADHLLQKLKDKKILTANNFAAIA